MWIEATLIREAAQLYGTTKRRYASTAWD